MNKGLTGDEASLLKSEFYEKFGLELPEEYLSFLKRVNGYDQDLITFYGYNADTYGSEIGFVGPDLDIFRQQNQQRKDRIYLGEDSSGNPFYYHMNGITRDLFCLDHFESGSLYSEVIEFLSFEEMLDYIFANSSVGAPK